jgi:hypothetical protein
MAGETGVKSSTHPPAKTSIFYTKSPNLVSVVRSKAALGSRFNILAQAGKVIEEEQSDDVYLQAAA